MYQDGVWRWTKNISLKWNSHVADAARSTAAIASMLSNRKRRDTLSQPLNQLALSNAVLPCRPFNWGSTRKVNDLFDLPATLPSRISRPTSFRNFFSDSIHSHSADNILQADILFINMCIEDAQNDCRCLEQSFLSIMKLSLFFSWDEPVT